MDTHLTHDATVNHYSVGVSETGITIPVQPKYMVTPQQAINLALFLLHASLSCGSSRVGIANVWSLISGGDSLIPLRNSEIEGLYRNRPLRLDDTSP